jgi:diguanylate cyclase (GGDEF)-like protein
MTVDSAASDFPDGMPSGAWRGLSRQADDTVLVLDRDGTCVWSSSLEAPRPGSLLRDAFRPQDAALVSTLLSDAPAGPVWLGLFVEPDADRLVSVVSVPRDGSAGWFVQLRSTHGAGDAAGLDGHSTESHPLTGAAGRERALEEVAWLLSATPRTGKEIAVACCELDADASASGQRGGLVGEEVLRVLAGRISDALRTGDLVARLDGDRLLVVLRGVHHLRGAIRVANKIRVAVEDPIPLATGDLVRTMSLGVTLISRGESVESVLMRAEGAMAMAKESGGNAVASSPPI